MSWQNIVKQGRPKLTQRGSILNIDGFITQVNILEWNHEGKERTGNCEVVWGFQLIIRADYIREMCMGVDKIVFDDGTVYEEDEIQTDVSGKPFGSGRFHPTSVYFDENDEDPLVSFETY